MPDEDTELPDTTTHILSSLYKKVDALPKLEMELDRDAKKLFATFCRAIEKERADERKHKQGTRAMLGKMPEKVGKMAAIIHTINCVVNGVEVDLMIPRGAVEAAIKFVKFTSDQIVNLYTEFSDRSALAPNLMKIIQAAELRGGEISVREVRAPFNEKQRPEVQRVREWFTELEVLNYGEVTTKGRKVTFTLSPRPHSPTLAQNIETERVSHAHTSENTRPHSPTLDNFNVGECGRNVGDPPTPVKTLSSKDLNTTVGGVGVNSQLSENSETQMLSCTTESAEFTDEHHAKILADKMREAIASSNFEGAKEIVKQVNVSTSQLRASFWQNLDRTGEKNKARLLAFANLSEGAPVKYVGKIEQYAQEKLTAYDADGHGGITCLLANGRSFTTWIPTRDLRKKL
jgi:hypothetical protein